MKFICVLFVGGSLASYQVTKESDSCYRAELRKGAGALRTDLPQLIELRRQEDRWLGEPNHKEVVRALGHALETAV